MGQIIDRVAPIGHVLVVDDTFTPAAARAARNLERVTMQEATKLNTLDLCTFTKIVMSTHNLGQARRLGDEVIYLHQGRVADPEGRDELAESWYAVVPGLGAPRLAGEPGQHAAEGGGDQHDADGVAQPLARGRRAASSSGQGARS